MVTRISNPLFLTVLPSAGVDGLGWTLRVLSERDYTTVIADVRWFTAAGFAVDINAEGGGKVTLDAEDPVFTVPLPVGETSRLRDQEALWQVLEDGQVRFEFLAEDVDEDIIPDGGGPRQTVIAGRGTASVLEWAPVLPAGMPAPTSMTRDFIAHPMDVWTQLLAEAQADGYLEWVTPTFDAVNDSQGIPWASGPQALTVNAGDTLLDLLKRWCDANELSWRMLPGFRLEVRQAGGVHHENQIIFTQYRSQGEHKRKITRRELANVIFADSGDNGLAFSEDTDSVLKWRKRAAWVSAGDAADATARSAIANTSLVLSKDQRLSRSVKIIPDTAGRHPFIDFDVQDWITVEVPDDDVESGARRVMGLAVDIDKDGAVTYEATLQSRFEARAVKIQRLLDKLGGSERSGSGSAAASPIPVVKSLSVMKLTDLSDVDLTAPAAGSMLQWNGSRWIDVTVNLDLLTDVDTGTIPGTGEVSLILDRPSGLWKPAVASGGGGATDLDGLTDVDVPAPGDGQVLTYDDASGLWIPGTPAAPGATTLDGLTDATVASPVNNEVLVYETSSSQWKNKPVPAQTLDSLSDATITSPANGQALIYDSASGQWKNLALPAAGDLDSLSDTTVTSPANNQVLVYESSTGLWKNKAVPAQTLDLLSDTTVTSPADTEVLTYEASSSQWKNKPLPGPGNIDSLTDVQSSGPSNGQVLTYETSTGLWKPATPAAPGATNLDGLSDVTVSGTPSNGQVLAYETASSQWKPATPSAGSGAAVAIALVFGG